jgi:hypothetical protein
VTRPKSSYARLPNGHLFIRHHGHDGSTHIPTGKERTDNGAARAERRLTGASCSQAAIERSEAPSRRQQVRRLPEPHTTCKLSQGQRKHSSCRQRTFSRASRAARASEPTAACAGNHRGAMGTVSGVASQEPEIGVRNTHLAGGRLAARRRDELGRVCTRNKTEHDHQHQQHTGSVRRTKERTCNERATNSGKSTNRQHAQMDSRPNEDAPATGPKL